MKLARRSKRHKIRNHYEGHRRPGERTPEEEEAIRASEAMDRILIRISQSHVIKGGEGTKATMKLTNSWFPQATTTVTTAVAATVEPSNGNHKGNNDKAS